ncbi:hypothetical protein ACWD2L_00310 [Streptomyces sp. NPDC002754]
MTDIPPPGMQGPETLIAELSEGIAELQRAVSEADLARTTWLALAIAEQAQGWASRAVNVDDTTDERRFRSMDGLLVDSVGAVIEASEVRFPRLTDAFARAQVTG